MQKQTKSRFGADGMVGSDSGYRIAVLVTCHNRCDVTLRSLASLYAQEEMDGFHLEILLVDDGSTDGTAEAVRERFPGVRVLRGDGSLFWNGGMRKAFAAALEEDFDAYLWFNDDTVLYPDALVRMMRCDKTACDAGRVAIVAGSTCNPLTGEQSYGGFRRYTHGPVFRLEKLLPDAIERRYCDTVNGNFTLIPREVARAVGNIEPAFRHQFGDVDYGLRAKRLGFDLMIVPGYVGQCSEGSLKGTWKDAEAPLRKRWRDLRSPKGVPFAEWVLFTRRHYGWRWMHYAVSPYVKTLLSGLVPRFRRVFIRRSVQTARES